MSLFSKLCCFGTVALFACFASAQKCDDVAANQLELNKCGGTEAQRADKELNEVYQRLLKLYADDHKFIRQLRAAQRSWISFRDAELQMKFPHADEPGYYGSVYPMCHTQYLTELTRARTKQLRVWLKGIPEGDVCAGSVKQAGQL